MCCLHSTWITPSNSRSDRVRINCMQDRSVTWLPNTVLFLSRDYQIRYCSYHVTVKYGIAHVTRLIECGVRIGCSRDRCVIIIYNWKTKAGWFGSSSGHCLVSMRITWVLRTCHVTTRDYMSRDFLHTPHYRAKEGYGQICGLTRTHTSTYWAYLASQGTIGGLDPVKIGILILWNIAQ